MAKLASLIEAHRPDLSLYESLYKDIHQHPTLSLQEAPVAELAAKHLRQYGYTVKSRIGGHGLFGVFENGPGKTILLRADMDALPVEEQTGLPYASRYRQIDVEDGVEKPTMHACGHDMHISCMLAAANALSCMSGAWHGTVVILFQPNEERGAGARAMVEDGLYDPAKHGCPIPDFLLAQHLMPFAAGKMGTRRGLMASAADGFKITVYGRGGHASQPHRTIDPVLLASHAVVRLQSIVSREVPPDETAVVTVGSIQAGTTENIIVDHAVMKVSLRTNNAATREKVLEGLKRIVRAECAASASPQEPLFEHNIEAPLTINDDNVVKSLEGPFEEYFGDDYVNPVPRLGGSEDFALLAIAVGKPYCYWTFGGVDPKNWKDAEEKGRLEEDIPINHSPFFAPVIQPTLRVGTDALVLAVLNFLKTEEDDSMSAARNQSKSQA